MEVFSMNILAGRQRAVERNCTIYTSNKEVFLFPTSLSTFDIFELFLKISSHCFFSVIWDFLSFCHLPVRHDFSPKGQDFSQM